MEYQITQEQSVVIGLVAMVIVFAINLVAKRLNRPLGRGWLTGLLFAVSFVLAVIFVGSALPAFPAWGDDPSLFALAVVAWLFDLLTVLSFVVGVAVSVYNVLGEKVMERVASWFVGDVTLG